MTKKNTLIALLLLLMSVLNTQALDIPKGTVFWTYSNAVKKLRRYYTGGEKDEK